MNGIVKIPNFDVHNNAPNKSYKLIQVPIESVSPAGALAPISTLKPIANAMLTKHPGLFPLMVHCTLFLVNSTTFEFF